MAVDVASGKNTRIVATMITGNSEAIAADAAASVVDFVNTICIIDTGITDGTTDAACKVAKGKLHIETFRWTGDFSSARNAALACATQLGAAWALTIDADERMHFDYPSQRELLEALGAAEVPVWHVRSKDGGYYKERFIRVPTSLKWTGRVHECFGAPHRGILEGCTFSELAKSPESYRRKLERDLPILIQETHDNPTNPRHYYYLGQTLEGLGEYERAISAFEACVALDGWQDEAAWACYTAARCCTSIGEYKKAEEYCARGLTKNPSMAELPWLAGWCCYKRGAYKDANTWSRLAMCLAKENRGGVFRHVPAWYEGPYDVMRHAYEAMGDVDNSRNAKNMFQIEKTRRESCLKMQ
jgi:tetratricopeptide (TPR) repeat protein